VAAAGGDGTAHEVANGLLASGRPDVVFAAWPAGSMNDYAFACGLDRWWAGGRREPLAVLAADVLRVRIGKLERYAVNGMGVGFNGLVTVESWRLRRLSGLALYAAGFALAAARRYATPPVELTIDGHTTAGPTLAFSFCLGRREGGFPLFPAARLDDGLAETLHISGARRVELFRHLPGLAAGRLPQGHPHVRTGRGRSVRVRSAAGLCVHLDGEVIRLPDAGPTEVLAEVLPGRLRVDVCPAHLKP
jgi:diacylglycerol kinase family enzyme